MTSTPDIKNKLALGRTLGLAEAGIAITGGVALSVLSGGIVPIVFGAAAALTGVYRTIAIARGWNKPETFVVSGQSKPYANDPDIIDTQSRFGLQNMSGLGGIAKIGAGIGLIGLAAAGGIAGAGLLTAGIIMTGVGIVAAAPAVVLIPLLISALVIALRNRKGIKAALKESRALTPAKSSLASRTLKAVFNAALPTKEHAPLLSTGLGSITWSGRKFADRSVLSIQHNNDGTITKIYKDPKKNPPRQAGPQSGQ